MRAILRFLLYIYRRLSPAIAQCVIFCGGIPTQCKYPISCSRYAEEKLNSNENLISVVASIILRVLSCNPLVRSLRFHHR